MPKNANQRWMSMNGGPRMQNGWYMNGSDKISQDFYFPDDHPKFPGWFKGMENIIHECGLWPNEGLKAQCDGFKCVSGHTNCCTCQVLFCQPDFCSQKSHQEEYITSRGHICDFYPKCHCELNFIEQYWGTAKYHYWSSQRLWYATACYISAYARGLSSSDAAWANRRYHGHRTLPPWMARKAQDRLE